MTILRRMSLVASRPLLTACATLVLSACGSGGASTQATPAAQVTPTQPSYVLHEWGFIAASLADGDLRGVTGPHGLSSMPPSASSYGGLGGLGLGSVGVGAGGKPVLYFHLDEGTDELAISVGIRPAGEGQLLEHFPPGELSAENRQLRWPAVRITRGACRGTYPTGADPVCQTPDGLCELAELAAYESASADCVNVGEERAGVLFYRTGPARAGLPLVVARDEQGVVSVSHPVSADSARFRGWVMRIARGHDRTASRVRIASITGGDPLTLPPAIGDGTVGADEAIPQLRAAIEAGGLDSAEADAFMAAWTDALFGGLPLPPAPPPDPNTIGMGFSAHPTHPLGSVADAILYVLPQASVDGLLPLELAPAPRIVRRVFVARVALTQEPIRIQFQTLTAQGGLDSGVVRRILRRHVGQLRACVETGVEPGRVVFTLNLLPTGLVENVVMEGADVGDEARACLIGAIQRLQFPVADVATVAVQPVVIGR